MQQTILQQEIEGKLFGKKNRANPKDLYVDFIYLFTREFHLSLDEINEMSIPLAFKLVSKLKAERDYEKKEMEKSRRKK